MSKILVSTEVCEASNKIGTALKTICVNTKKALADGWQPGQDIPVILVGSMTDLLAAVAVANQLGEDAKDPLEMAFGILIPLKEGAQELLKK